MRCLPMNTPQIAAEIEALLEKHPGVRVEQVRIDAPSLQLTLRITDAASLAQIIHAADGANARRSVYSIDKAPDGATAAESLDCLRWQFFLETADEETADEGAPAQGKADENAPRTAPSAQRFGLFLVWHLKPAGHLPLAEAQRLLALWKGAPRW